MPTRALRPLRDAPGPDAGPADPGAAAGPGPRSRRRRRAVIVSVQVALLVGGIGLWQLLASTHTIDVFFYGDPAGTWRQLTDWVHNGTTEGPLWQQIWVTLQETGLPSALPYALVLLVVALPLPLAAYIWSARAGRRRRG